MMHNIFQKKILSTTITACCIGSVGSLALCCYLVKKFTARPIYSARRIAEHERNRTLLLNELKAEPIIFYAHDGVALHGYLIIRQQATRALLLCHGYRMCKERMYGIVQMFPDDTILLFDHRAHGQSDGSCTTFGHLEQHDVRAAVNFLQTHAQTKELPIIGIGVSMGAISLLAAACSGEHFKAVVLDSPFLRLDKQARRLLAKRYNVPQISVRLLGEHIFAAIMNFSLRDVNALNWADKLKIPTLIIHSQHDDTVPIKDAITLFNALKTVKDFWQVEASGHARIFNDCFEQYQSKVRDFFNHL